ncbi:hypothetical protein VP01_1319g2 [Puccinia sorghi]|uniref:Uncharacterized protein n=1 Tax=Puccinia sorghi TaxID=27349 RepID=A0A0L6VMP0_9BASI|nr:hypothetical protein VP01_1319g2 [Puccinia sorghi]
MFRRKGSSFSVFEFQSSALHRLIEKGRYFQDFFFLFLCSSEPKRATFYQEDVLQRGKRLVCSGDWRFEMLTSKTAVDCPVSPSGFTSLHHICAAETKDCVHGLSLVKTEEGASDAVGPKRATVIIFKQLLKRPLKKLFHESVLFEPKRVSLVPPVGALIGPMGSSTSSSGSASENSVKSQVFLMPAGPTPWPKSQASGKLPKRTKKVIGVLFCAFEVNFGINQYFDNILFFNLFQRDPVPQNRTNDDNIDPQIMDDQNNVSFFLSLHSSFLLEKLTIDPSIFFKKNYSKPSLSLQKSVWKPIAPQKSFKLLLNVTVFNKLVNYHLSDIASFDQWINSRINSLQHLTYIQLYLAELGCKLSDYLKFIKIQTDKQEGILKKINQINIGSYKMFLLKSITQCQMSRGGLSNSIITQLCNTASRYKKHSKKKLLHFSSTENLCLIVSFVSSNFSLINHR